MTRQDTPSIRTCRPQPGKKSKRLAGNKAKLKKGTKVEILEVKTAWNGTQWIRIKSGWLPVCVKGVYRIKEA